MQKKQLACRLECYCEERSTMYRRLDALLKPFGLRQFAPGKSLYVVDLDNAPDWLKSKLG